MRGVDISRRSAAGLAEMLIERELALAEINPLFVSTSACVAGDAKLVVDLGAVERQPRIAALIEARPGIYADANRKLREGFDYVELDPAGEIGLVTTGAGLSMMLIDELTARGSQAAELLRRPHRPDARQPGAADACAGMAHVAAIAARGAGQHLRRHHRSRRVRRTAGDCDRADPEPSRARRGAAGGPRRRRGAAHSGGPPARRVRHRGSWKRRCDASTPSSWVRGRDRHALAQHACHRAGHHGSHGAHALRR